MSFIDKWFETYKTVLTEPKDFFESENRRNDFGFSIKFAFINLLIGGVFGAIGTLMFGSLATLLGGEMAIATPILAALTLVLSPFLGLIGLIISSGLLHIFVYLLGGENGYSETLSVMGYVTVINPISSAFSLIPFLGGLASFLLSIYGVYIQMRGLESFQRLSTGRALAAILITIVLITFITIAVFFAAILGGVTHAGA
jgi:hypothetical protein